MLPYFIIFLVFLADRLSKWWVISYLGEHGPTRINALFSIQETYNRGIAFGMFQGIGPLVGWLTIAVVVGMLIYLVHLPKEEKLVQIGLALLIGGALGNLIDRIIVGKVLDFIVTPLRPGIFNVADVAINLGIIIILLATIWSALRPRNQDLAEAPPSKQNG
jgi:signal peptidase II